MSDVSVICCYNNLTQYQKLYNSLGNQSVYVDIVGIDNRKNSFSSCSKAYNYGIKKVKTEYVIFAHQDVELITEDTIRYFLSFLETTNENDILGVAGRKQGGKKVITNIRHGKTKSYAGGQRLTGIEQCQTIDECFFGGHTRHFISNAFDEVLCDNWHLCAVEQCLRSISNGGKVYVCDVELIHNSSGRINYVYNRQFYKLSKKYEKKFEYISTPSRSSKTRLPFRLMTYIIYTIRAFQIMYKHKFR